MATWTEVAKHAQRLEDWDKTQRKIKVKSMQRTVREELDQQIAEKKDRDKEDESVELLYHNFQEAEIEQWKKDEEAKVVHARNKAINTRDDRKLQAEEKRQRLEVGKCLKIAEEKEMVASALYDLHQEESEHEAKKEAQKDVMLRLVDEWDKNRDVRENLKKQVYSSERNDLKLYNDLLDEHAERRQKTEQQLRDKYSYVGKVSQPDKYIKPPPRGLGGGENDESTVFVDKGEEMAIVKRVKSLQNQEFLFEQMADKHVKKCAAQVEDKSQIGVVVAEQRAFIQAEQRSSKERLLSSVQYRVELEKQIKAKGEVARAVDHMSKNEAAVNRRLLEEVSALRQGHNISLSQRRM